MEVWKSSIQFCLAPSSGPQRGPFEGCKISILYTLVSEFENIYRIFSNRVARKWFFCKKIRHFSVSTAYPLGVSRPWRGDSKGNLKTFVEFLNSSCVFTSPLFPSRGGCGSTGLASRKEGWPEYSHPVPLMGEVQGKNPYPLHRRCTGL